MRFAKQQDNYRCGPYAMYNLMKWYEIRYFFGQRVTKKMIFRLLTYLCKTKRNVGTYPNDLLNALSFLPRLSAYPIKLDKIKRLKKAVIKNGYAAIISVRDDKDDSSHWVLLLPSISHDAVGVGFFTDPLMIGIKEQDINDLKPFLEDVIIILPSLETDKPGFAD